MPGCVFSSISNFLSLLSAQTQFPVFSDMLLSLKQLPLPGRKRRAALQKAIHLVFHCPLLKGDYGFWLRPDYCQINKTLKKPQWARQQVCGTGRAPLLLCVIHSADEHMCVHVTSTIWHTHMDTTPPLFSLSPSAAQTQGLKLAS